MPPEATHLILWLLPTTLLGSVAYVLKAEHIASRRAIIGMVLYATLSATLVGMALLIIGKPLMACLIGGLAASLCGPFWVETMRNVLQRELARRFGQEEAQSQDPQDHPKPNTNRHDNHPPSQTE